MMTEVALPARISGIEKGSTMSACKLRTASLIVSSLPSKFSRSRPVARYLVGEDDPRGDGMAPVLSIYRDDWCLGYVLRVE